MPWLILSGVGVSTRRQLIYCWHQAQTIRREAKASDEPAPGIDALSLKPFGSTVILLSPWQYLGYCAPASEATRSGQGTAPDVVAKPCAAYARAPSQRAVSLGARQDIPRTFICPPQRNLGDTMPLSKSKFSFDAMSSMALAFSVPLQTVLAVPCYLHGSKISCNQVIWSVHELCLRSLSIAAIA
jgi:hypothetical protein